jgi:hypothetical protein
MAGCILAVFGLVEFLTGGRIIFRKFTEKNKDVIDPALYARILGLWICAMAISQAWMFNVARNDPSGIGIAILVMVFVMASVPVLILILTLKHTLPGISSDLSTKRENITNRESDMISKMKKIMVIGLIAGLIISFAIVYVVLSVVF